MKVEQALRINVTHVPQEGRDYTFVLEPDWLEERLGDCGVLAPFLQGRLSVRVSPLGQNYYVKGRLTLPVRLTCVRCLKEVAITLELPLSIVMVREGSGGGISKLTVPATVLPLASFT